ncbi:hypothetical protein CVIRNUC_008011 [Coccomyxa viridis]|uniref:Uncharacterized protein n=1 Tax=Coccomyxa viridis TaxID=1274662 RepID=A0AAV1IDL4_9CHLO|nr:hypothetical protein CVIRNUC_008011 [Coccomyxa viridis]
MAGQEELARNPWTDWASQAASLQSSAAVSQINFQPLRLSAAGEQEADPVARARTASSEGFRPVRTSSPHAAAATRRFLAVNASASRTAGTSRQAQTPASPNRMRTLQQQQTAIAVTSRAETVAPMPLFTAGGQSVPVLSGNTSTFMGGQSAAAFHSSASGQEGQVPEASLRPTSRPTPGKAHEALERGSDDSEAAGAWHIPAGPRQEGNVAAKMGRREAWARFLAYDAAVQMCVKASRSGVAAAGSFLDAHSAALRQALNFEGLLLSPVPPGGDVCGATLWWDDAEAAVLPAVDFGPVLKREVGVRCAVHRLQCSSVYRPMLARAGAQQKPQLYISLRPARWTGEAMWTPITDDGRAVAQQPVELSQDDREDEMMVELHTDVGCIASAVARIADIWAIASETPALEPQPMQAERRRWCLFRCRRSGVPDEDIFGKKWVTLTDSAGNRYAHVQLSAWTSSTERTVMKASEALSAPHELSSEASGAAAHKSFQQITGWQIYDLMLEAALESQQCGPKRLQLTGPWLWLLTEFGETYGIRDTYAKLAHLRWVIRKENVSLTAYCLGLLEKDVEQLKGVQAAGALLPMEVKLLESIELACEEQLAVTFENYYSLTESAPSGLADNGAPSPEQPAPALRPAVGLCRVLKDVLSPTDPVWFQDRFQEAAIKRYGRLQAACNDAVGSDNLRRNRRTSTAEGQRNMPAHKAGPSADHTCASDQSGLADADLAYARLEALCGAVRGELEQDIHIHDAAVLPNFVNLPQVTAAEYGRMLVMDLKHTLEHFPPPQPSAGAVNLLVTVGKHQEYLMQHGLLPPRNHPGSLDALEVFGKHVSRWIDTSQAAMCLRCQQIEASGLATAMLGERTDEGRTYVAPLVDEMLSRIEAEVRRYERVITYWRVFGPQLEGAVCASLRETTAAVTRQCGLAQVRTDGRPGAMFGADERSSPNRWRWNAAMASTGPGRLTVLPHEAVLLNSVRRLLSVVPQTEHTIATWASGPLAGPPPSAFPSPHGGQESPSRAREAAQGPEDGPEMGAQFAQLVKELRSEYSGAVQACAFRISQGVTNQANSSLKSILEQHGISGTPTLLQQLTGPMLEKVEEVVLGLTRLLDSRVFVALGRGLWDFTAKDVYDYVESLQEDRHNKGAWKGRQNAAAALDVVDNFYSTLLSATLQHDIQEKDLDLPLHSDRAHRLLEPNTAAINMSYTVF